MAVAGRTITAAAGAALVRLISGKRLIRAIAHGACWVPFIACTADSWRGSWRAVGDGAQIALTSWGTFSAAFPLIGKSNELPHAPHDLGPLQFWLLALPVHADADRGVLWGAALLAMLAASLTVEAAYSVRGVTGGLLASGVVIATVVWFPGFAAWPFDNPNYGMMYFLAALSCCLAVLTGHRRWWPVLVITASMAAQAYLTYAAASVGLVLIAAVAGLADTFRAKGGYRWLIAGVIAGAACWAAPLSQQLASPAGQGNMSMLLHDDAGPQVGFAFAMKVAASLAAPSSLWWRVGATAPLNLSHLLTSKPAALGLVILAITAASLVTAACWLRSRELAGLAAISLLVGVTAALTFARIPVQAHAVGGPHSPFGDLPLIFVMFTAALLAWLTTICVIVAAAARLISYRPARAGATRPPAPAGQQQARPNLVSVTARGAAALVLALTALLLLGVRTVAHYSGSGPGSQRVSAALAAIERSLASHTIITLSVSSARKGDKYPVNLGLDWALTADGYQFDTTPSTRTRTLTQIAIVIHGPTTTVRIQQRICRPVADTPSMRHRLCAPGHEMRPAPGIAASHGRPARKLPGRPPRLVKTAPAS